MPEKYHIDVKNVPPRHYPVGKYATVEFWENCAGSCRECVKKKCVYGIFKDNFLHMTTMDEPQYLYTCNSCFRCVQECTKGIFSRVINPEYRTLGDEYWTPDILHRTWYQAHTGSIPVSGAGYRGPFVGAGFDSMWTDMSEIVRPTRDGIHGREYINTGIELSRRPARLRFNSDMSLAVEVGPIFEIPIPILFQQPPFGAPGRHILVAMASAAGVLGTMMLVRAADLKADLKEYAGNIIPRVTRASYAAHSAFLQSCKMVEIAYEPGIADEFAKLRGINPKLFIAVGIPLDKAAASIAEELAASGVDTLHYYADDNGREIDAEKPRFLKEMIREVHLALVDKSCRQQLNLIFSGGIALAEHVNKAIICGADGVAIDNPLLIAMECRMCGRCKDGLSCPATLEEITPEYGRDRIVNLMGAWHNQMLEMLGAMGLREARRLRGEVGRSMWFEDLEKENFGPLFGERKVPPVV
jgi:ferredoxin